MTNHFSGGTYFSVNLTTVILCQRFGCIIIQENIFQWDWMRSESAILESRRENIDLEKLPMYEHEEFVPGLDEECKKILGFIFPKELLQIISNYLPTFISPMTR